jgi:hypothetical protein
MKIFYLFFFNLKYNLSLYLHSNKSKNYIKSNSFFDYIKNNKNLWNKKKIENIKDFYIAIDCTSSHPFNLIQNLVIGKYLQKIFNYKILIIDTFNDNYRSQLYDSFLISNIFFLGKIFDLKLFTKVIKILNNLLYNINNIEDFINLRYENIEVGKISYDDYLRNTFKGTENKINYKLIFFLFKVLNSLEKIKKIKLINKIKIYNTHEIQFNPEAILFQFFLKNNCQIFCKGIGQTEIGLRKFTKFSQRMYNRHSMSKNLFIKLYKSENNHLYEKSGFDLIKKRFENKRNINDIHDLTFAYDPKKKIVDRKYICDLFNWDINKPIIVVFANNIFDGVFEKRTSLFQDNYIWLQKTTQLLSNNNNINILVKKHPTEFVTSKIKDVTLNVVNNIKQNCKFIEIFPENIHPSSILNFAQCILTEHGNAGVEYSCYGIPAIITGDASYYKLGFAYEPKNIIQYENLIKDIHKIKKLNQDQVKKARIFAYAYINLIKVKTRLNASTETIQTLNDPCYWKKLSTNIEGFNFENCLFYKMLNKMIIEKNYNIYDENKLLVSSSY